MNRKTMFLLVFLLVVIGGSVISFEAAKNGILRDYLPFFRLFGYAATYGCLGYVVYRGIVSRRNRKL